MTSPSDRPAIDAPRPGRELVILPAPGPRGSGHHLRNLGIVAACLMLAAALGWGAGAHLGAAPKVMTSQKADMARLASESEATQRQEAQRQEAQRQEAQRQELRQLAEDVRALKDGFAGLQTSLGRARPADDVKALKAGLEALKLGLDASKSDMAGALSQLSGKLDRADQGTAQKLAQIAERLDRLERKPDPMPVGSIVPQPPARPSNVLPLPLPGNAQPQPKSIEAGVQAPPKAPIQGWVLREVYDGIALVEGRGGYREVQVGEAIPGAGKVEAIEKRGRRWVVVTSQGLIAEVN
jgi:TolA-binding protein